MNKRIILLQKAANVSGPLRFVPFDTLEFSTWFHVQPFIFCSGLSYIYITAFFFCNPHPFFFTRKYFYFNSKRSVGERLIIAWGKSGRRHDWVRKFDHITSVDWSSFINPSTLQSHNASNPAASLPQQWGLHVLVTHPRIAAFGEFVDGEGLEPACEVYYGIWQERYGDELAAKAVACSEYKWHVL